ncbi:MBL fold metallo-hydrolase [Mycolicibacterium smegmatis]|uniref:Metallo-beta-lactamase family protein n=1 Tax=Mycolicibacterium smegmatis (strain MKD8) TaxID=1214915 RepID=A0A2U9Q088_MYCSE|nr:MBL fold metallo-hydrolase [Mycolicibacterium smegmatis]AWT57472.1 metallo-beta-lactamase family protein [Mycolicibacterium smegmatis MKD8]
MPPLEQNTIGNGGDRAAVRSLTFDDITVTYVVDGVIALRPEVFFPAVPADAWTELVTAGGELLMSAGGLLVEIAGSTVLIDAGVGRMTETPSFGGVDCGSLIDVLGALGVPPGDIDVVAFTHLHFDHAGWAFTDGTKTFPNARYVVAADELAPYGTAERNDDPTAPWDAITRLAGGEHDVVTVQDGEQVVPGVHAVVTGGHTPGHTSYVVTSAAGQRLVVFGDAFHTPAQLSHLHWLSSVDPDDGSVLRARLRLLTELDRPDTVGFAFHFGDQPFGRVVTDASGVRVWEPVASQLVAPPPRR